MTREGAARLLRELHRPGLPLVLPNVWDAVSARLVALFEADRRADRLAAIRAAADTAGVPLVINARVDVFVHAGGRGETDVVEEAIRRGRRYPAAGADCVHPILAAGEETVAGLVKAIGGPVNIFYRPGTPALPRLAELGVARVSFGAGLHRAASAWLRDMVERFARNQQPPY